MIDKETTEWLIKANSDLKIVEHLNFISSSLYTQYSILVILYAIRCTQNAKMYLAHLYIFKNLIL